MQLTKLILFAFLLTLSGQTCSGSVWDSIPIISQVKSLVQVISGDAEGAKKTQENFVDTAPVVSQVKSAVQSASGDNEGAKKTQEKFVKNVEQVVDATPVLGHIKGGIHVAAGDKEHGLEIIKGASSSTGSLIGGLLAGPAGAVLGGVATDGLITGIDSAVNKQFSPFGTVDFLANIKDQSSGDVFDQLLGTGLDLVGGSAAKSKGNKPKKKDNPETPDRGFGMDSDHVRGQIDEGALRPDDMQIDVDSPAFLDVARRNTGLEPALANRLEQIDFRDVNDIDGTMNCYFCTAAAFKNTFASDLVRRYEIMMDASGAPSVQHIVDLFKEIGFPDTRLVFEGEPHGLFTFLENNMPPGQSSSFALAFRRIDGTGHVVLLRAWREQNGVGQILTTDYQRPVNHPNRFSKELPPNIKTLYLIQPQFITSITELQINDLIDGINGLTLSSLLSSSGQKSCANKRIIGYLASWSSRRFTVEQSLHLTNVIYAFISMDAEGGLTIPTPTTAKQRLLDVMVAKQAHLSKGLDLKVSFAVGGWENSQYFSAVIGDAGKRSKLIASIATIIRDFKFDGVDIDWEYPVAGGATKGVDSDKENYVKFLSDLRYALGNDYLISIAGAAGQEALEGFDLENIIKIVDWIGVMSYDLNGAWDSEWGAFVGPNAPLHHGAPLGYSGKLNVNWALKQYACNTKNPNKIIMGIPFYGRYWFKTIDGKDPSGHPLFRKAEKVNGKYGGDKSYRELVITWLSSSGGFDKRWDDKTKTPWAIHPENNLVLTYDDPKSIKMKVDYAIEHNLGGVMVWSVEQDDEQLSLLKTVSSNACRETGNSVNYKCSPIKGKRWWTWLEDKEKAGMCGKGSPLYKGFYPLCDPDDPGYSCCSKDGYCGSGPKFCDCEGCVDYEKDPEKLIAEPIKPSRPIQWHVGFDSVKPGQPRCGVHAKPLSNGFYAICNPDDTNAPCCSKWGYCGSGKDNCECSGCKDYRKISIADSMKKVRTPEEIQWHVGNDVVKQGEPRCGTSAPKINGKMAICDPEDEGGPCCSKWGFCGVGDDFCKCDGCFDSRSL